MVLCQCLSGWAFLQDVLALVVIAVFDLKNAWGSLRYSSPLPLPLGVQWEGKASLSPVMVQE